MHRRYFKPFFLWLLLAVTVFGRAQSPAHKPLLVGYFGQWGLYSSPQYTLKDLAANNKIAMLDQLNYAQASVAGGRCSIADPHADLDYSFMASNSVSGQPDDSAAPFRGYFHQLVELKHAYPRLKVLISLEGRANDFAFDAQPENREAFIASCVDLFIKGNLTPNVSAPGLFDGIDVDWEFPRGADAGNFIALLTEFRRQMDAVRAGLKLSIAVGPSPRMYEGSDFAALAGQVDEIGMMTYDFAGPWMQTTGFIAPLYSVPRPQQMVTQSSSAAVPTGPNPTASTTVAANAAVPAASVSSSVPAPHPPHGGVAGSAQAFLAAGVPAEKLLIGVPFYGYGWTNVPETGDGVFQEGTPVRGDRPYSYIQSLISGSVVHRDPVSYAPWLFDGDAFWTFDDPVSVQAKAAYAVENHLGGVMIWELSEDSAQATLLTAAHQGLTQPAPIAAAR